MERILKAAAGIAAVLTLVFLGLGMTGGKSWPAWPAMVALYLTGVTFGFGDMTRLYHRHRRRCRECLSGAGPHLRWWAFRVVLVLVVSILPVLLLFPALSGGR